MRISDWSSDVCSSDLSASFIPPSAIADGFGRRDDVVDGRQRQLFQIGGIGHRHVLAADPRHRRVEIVEGQFHHAGGNLRADTRSEEHTSELQSLMRISYAVYRLKKKKRTHTTPHSTNT